MSGGFIKSDPGFVTFPPIITPFLLITGMPLGVGSLLPGPLFTPS